MKANRLGKLNFILHVKVKIKLIDAIKLRICGLANHLRLSGKKITIKSLIENE